jgi:hypothetical protein
LDTVSAAKVLETSYSALDELRELKKSGGSMSHSLYCKLFHLLQEDVPKLCNAVATANDKKGEVS